MRVAVARPTGALIRHMNRMGACAIAPWNVCPRTWGGGNETGEHMSRLAGKDCTEGDKASPSRVGSYDEMYQAALEVKS